MAIPKFNILSKPPPDEDKMGWYRWFYRVAEIINNLFLTPAAATGDYTAKNNDIVLCDCTAGIITVTPPPATYGGQFYVRKIDTTSNKVIIAGVGDILFQYTCIHCIYDGTDWIPA